MKTGSIKSLLTISILTMFLLTMPLSASAVPASPQLHKLKQADGSAFIARQWGDETLHGWETKDGYSIVFDKATRNWTYAKQGRGGRLASTSSIVGADTPPSSSQGLRPSIEIPADRYKTSKEMVKSSVLGAAKNPYLSVVPPTGTGKMPVVLMNFSNTSTTYTSSNFNSSLFGTGNNSMNDFYKQGSYNAFGVAGGVSPWYTASNTHDYYGANDAFDDDLRPRELILEAVTQADAYFNWANYDLDGDCFVDVVNVVHQGTDEASGGSDTDIWSHRWTLASPYTTLDNCPAGGKMKISDYVTEAEKKTGGQQETIGVFAHEYGHALGLPDFYDYGLESAGIGDWSVMAYGSYNKASGGLSGDRPAQFDAWSKYRLGWVVPQNVTGSKYSESILTAATNKDVYKMGTGTPTSGEYFLIENRQKTGFDIGLPGAGLLIWHVDGGLLVSDMSPNENECWPGSVPGCATQHFGVGLLQADNLWQLDQGPWTSQGDAGDPFPGSTNKTAWNNTSSPNSKRYSGAASNYSISGISASAATMTATFTMGLPSAAPGSLSAIATSPNAIVLTWKDLSTNEESFRIERRIGDCSSSVGFSQIGTVNHGAPNTWTSGTFAANTTYAFRVRAANGSGYSGYSACSSAKTGALGSPVSPVDLVIEPQSSNKIHVRWDDNSTNETSFRIYRRVGLFGAWSHRSTLAAGSQSWDDSYASGNTTTTKYYYKVTACNKAGCSPYTVTAGNLFAPTGQILTSPFAGTIKSTWTDKSVDEGGFYIYRKPGGCWVSGTWTNIGTTNTNVTNYTNWGVGSGNTYSYKVKAQNASDAKPTAWSSSAFTPCASKTAP